MQKKSILLVTQGFPYGESERGFLPTEFAFLAEKFQVTVLAVGAASDTILYPLPDDVQVVSYHYGSLQHSPGTAMGNLFRMDSIQDFLIAASKCGDSAFAQRAKQSIAYGLNAALISKKMEEIIGKNNVRLVYTYWCTQATLAALRLKKKFPHLKVVTRFLGFDLYDERTETGRQPYRNEISHKADTLIFLGETDRRYFDEHWPIPSDTPCILSELGCKPMNYHGNISGEVLKIVSCSNLIELKRVHLIVEGLALLPDTIQVEWHHIGGGPLMEHLQLMAAEKLSSRKNISWRFHGAVAHDLVDGLYSEITPELFITTTATEGGIPVSIQEAFSAGLPVIATAVGGIPECLGNGKAGFLLGENPDGAAVAQAIEMYWNQSENQKQAMHISARELWEDKYDAEKNAARISSVLEAL